jgi:hypothetical protein
MRVLIATVTAGAGHLQAAAALDEAWRALRPGDAVERLDLLERGAAVKVNRVEDLPFRLQQLLGSRRLREMAKAAAALGRPDAARRVCEATLARAQGERYHLHVYRAGLVERPRPQRRTPPPACIACCRAAGSGNAGRRPPPAGRLAASSRCP